VVVRQQPTVDQGEMCAALIDGEASVKFFRRTRAGEIFLDPANDGYEPIPVTADQDAAILGKVVTVTVACSAASRAGAAPAGGPGPARHSRSAAQGSVAA
jgi:hypothetical protein